MRDAIDDADATLENALSLGVLLVIAGLAIFASVAGFRAAPPFTAPSEPTVYPIKIALGWPNPLRRAGASVPAPTSRSAAPVDAQVSDLSGEMPNPAEGAEQPGPSTSEASMAPAARQISDLQGTQSAGRSDGTTPFLISDFNLGSGPSASNAIEIRKPVLMNGRAAGTIRMRIDAAAEIYVRRDDIVRLLAGKIALPQGGDQDFIALDRIRERGIDVRYSAGQDALMITT
jgi:hypothetical protein